MTNLNDFKKFGEMTCLAMHEFDPSFTMGKLDAYDVESEDVVNSRNATNFYKSASAAAAAHEMETNGFTPEFVLLDKMSREEEWFNPMTEIVDNYLSDIVTTKSASIANLLPAGIWKGAQYTPALMKSLLALGILGGAGTGALYWGANRHINEDDSSINEDLQTKIQEYEKVRRMIESDIENDKIRNAKDLKQYSRTY